MLIHGYKSDKGISRSGNEDAFIILPKDKVYAVADGVGGNNAGEVASDTAIYEISDYVNNNPIMEAETEKELGAYVNACVKKANESVCAMGRKYPETSGLATTLVFCHIRGNKAYFANVGDSRAYIYREGDIFQVTEDHTYVQKLIDLGVLTEEQAREHESGHVITRAIGAEDEIEADLFQIQIHDKDIIILCSDGLYGEVSENEMAEIIEETPDMAELAEVLVDRANMNGGRDNITVVVLKFMED